MPLDHGERHADGGERAENIVGDARGELLQLLRLALHEGVVLLLNALDLSHHPDGREGGHCREQCAERGELPGDPASSVPYRFDALRGAFRHDDVVVDEVLRHQTGRVAERPQLAAHGLAGPVAVAGAGLLQRPLRGLFECRERAPQLAQEHRFPLVRGQRSCLREQAVDAPSRLLHLVPGFVVTLDGLDDPRVHLAKLRAQIADDADVGRCVP